MLTREIPHAFKIMCRAAYVVVWCAVMFSAVTFTIMLVNRGLAGTGFDSLVTGLIHVMVVGSVNFTFWKLGTRIYSFFPK